ncbi:polysaccharide deacetylase family protein [Taklimakanibacter deserti]|uniref:polysaccharide deacetylase family protein n=1 Tax=Taklimakanibacter deserti TaxID=2267839 RepID=UPI000E64776A
MTLWQPVESELARWRDLGLTPELWLRDDDAAEPTPKLDRLIALAEDYGIPVALAIVPARSGPALARRLETAPHIHPVIHGWSHANHAPQLEKKQELGPHRPRATVLNDLSAAFARLSELHGERLVSMLVPPWNRIDPGLLDDLPALGFRALSAFGHKLRPRPGLAVVNTHIDIIDSHAGNACRDHAWLVSALAEELTAARAAGGRPVGILSHHLVSDDEAFRFLRDLFTAAPPGIASWRTARDLLAA